MITYDLTWLKASVADDLRRRSRYGHFDGTPQSRRYLEKCTGFHRTSGSLLIFTRDVGHHESGWWKNPDYERCFHLSLSFRDPGTLQTAPRDKALTKEWVGLFFGRDASKLWCEPPYSPEGKMRETWHYRLFCNPAWEAIIPRGEVYSREFTEAGWKSWSDVQADIERVAAAKGD